MINSPWKNATIISGSALSDIVDLGLHYDTLLVIIPTLTSSNLTLYVSDTQDGTYVALGNTLTVTAGTGGFADIWELGGYQFLKIGTSAGQAANRTFKVAGVRS